MESTTPSGRDEQPDAKPAEEFAQELAKAAPQPKKPAVKRKPAAKKKATARRRSAATKPEPLSEMVGVGEVGELLGGAPAEPLQLAGIGIELADIVSGIRDHQKTVTGYRNADSSDPGSESRGLTLEELSTLLVQRERKGFAAGHEKGYQSARTAAMARLQRERSEAVAGALTMVVRQLEGVLNDLAGSDSEGKAEGVRHLEVLAEEFARAADRFAHGEDYGA